MSIVLRVRRLGLLVLVAVVAGCGGSSHPAATTTAATRPLPPGDVLYEGSAWAVGVVGTKATAYHWANGAWHADRTNKVKIEILGPRPNSTGNARIPQVAVQLTGNTDLADSALWLDGKELLTKGGGLTPRQGTIYSAPDAPLKKGKHVVVAYGRTATHATAIAWTFSV